MRKNRSSKWVRGLHLTVLFILLWPLTGCWSGTQVEHLAVVNVMGIDRNDAGQVEVTAVVLRPGTLFSNLPTSGEMSAQQGGPLIETTTGKSIFEAMGKLSSAIPEKIYFGHLNLIVFGEQAARHQMVASLDFFKREKDFRPNIRLFVARGTAKRLIQTKPKMKKTLGAELLDLAKSSRFSATNMVKDLSKFTEATISNTKDPYTGVIQAAKTEGIHVVYTKNDSTKSKQQKIPKMLSLRGTAAFKGGHLAGFLNEKETRGLLAIKGELNGGIATVKCGENGKGTVSLYFKNSKSHFSPQISGGNPEMNVDIHVKADIGDITCSDFKAHSASFEHLNAKLANLVKQDAKNALIQAKDHWQTDIFGFGEAFYRKYPEQWHQMAPMWRKGGLKKMKVHLTVSADILRHGLLKNPAKANETR